YFIRATSVLLTAHASPRSNPQIGMGTVELPEETTSSDAIWMDGGLPLALGRIFDVTRRRLHVLCGSVEISFGVLNPICMFLRKLVPLRLRLLFGVAI